MAPYRKIPDGISDAIRYDFSSDHNWSARYLASAAAEIERAGDASADLYQDHRACVIGSVMATVAFLESTINEVFSDCQARVWAARTGTISPAEQDALGQIWSREIRMLSTLRKYELALAVLRRPSLDRAANPYASARALITLRNELVHFEPEWIPLKRSDGRPLEQNQIHPMERLLRSRFASNALAEPTWGFWPELCLGAGCASWALTSAEAFVDEFMRRLGARAA